MRISSKIGIGLGGLAVALALGGGIGLWLSRQAAVPKIDLPPTPQLVSTTATQGTNVTWETNTMPDEPDMTMVVPEQSTNNWEQKLDDILVSDADEETKASNVLALMPTASEEGKVELAQHLVNLVQDDKYAGVAEMLTNSATPSAVSTVLMNDLLNRNNTLKLPMLLAIARNDDHPLKGDAKDMLELFLQDDKGPNWADWEVAVDQWLKDNAQE